MLSDKQIKIIKRAERDNSQTVGSVKRPINPRSHRENTKRDAVTVVTGWISELRGKKSEEATRGFEGLFGNAP